ncbi:MAG: glycosyltransferase family 1 protein [Phycisphaerales bacterium]|nr:MAG: glycosyltransferase family 1 protein [Phycisphaerales bacterium]
MTHRVLLKMAEQKEIFYVYDTLLGMQTASHGEHRNLTANMAKRSRYFLVYPGKIDREFETGGQREVGSRYFEGAAAGSVMIGECLETEAFREHLGWPDAVIRVPFDAPNIAKILADLDSQPTRMEQARKSNIVQSLLRHDWAYRWGTVLDMAGLKPKAALIDRLEYLKSMAEDVKKA